MNYSDFVAAISPIVNSVARQDQIGFSRCIVVDHACSNSYRMQAKRTKKPKDDQDKVRFARSTKKDSGGDVHGDGSMYKPFGSIGRALKHARETYNSNREPHLIELVPNTYPSLSMTENNLKYFSIKGRTSRYLGLDVVIDGDLICDKNNCCIDKMFIDSLHIKGNVLIEGARTGKSPFSTDLALINCMVDGNVTFRNTMVGVLSNCKVMGDIVFENVGVGSINGNPGHHAGKQITVRYDPGNKVPANIGACSVIIDNAVTGYFKLERVGNSGYAYLQIRKSSRIGHPGSTSEVGTGCILDTFGGTVRGNLQNNGSTTLRGGSFVTGTVSGSGGLTMRQPSSQINNDSNVLGVTVSDALNTLKAEIDALKG